jgi:uncharacterized glyoxalase superfamily protein PhnB
MDETTASTDHRSDTFDGPPPPMVWPTLNYTDARAAIRFLVDVLGFVERAVYTDESDDSVIVHAELRRPEGGGVMLGTANRPDNVFSQMPTGVSSMYVVTADPAAVHARAVAAGATMVRDLAETDYGSLDFSVRDPEGNIWSFGTYPGA